MALAQSIVRDVGGTIEFFAPVRPGAAPTVTVRTDGNAIIASAAVATVDSVNTTLSSAAGLEALTVAVASAASIVAGRQYRIGPADPATGTEMAEFIQVRSVSGTTVTLTSPLKYAHATATPFAGTRMSYLVTAAQANITFWDGHAEWTWTGLEHNYLTGLDCVRRRVRRNCTLAHVANHEPWLHQKLSASMDPETLLQEAFDDVLEHVGSQFRVKTMIGDDAFTRPTIFALGHLLARQHGDDARAAMYREELSAALKRLTSTRPADLDQDGAVESHEVAYSGGRIDRA